MCRITPMQQAKARFALKNVFFASIVMSTEVVESTLTATAWTDMVRIGYNPAFIDSLGDVDAVIFVLAHEVFHIILKHGLRRGGRDHEMWNKACDYAINLQLKKADFKVWSKALLDPAFEGMSAEQIYDELEKEKGARRGEKEKGARRGEDGCGRDIREPSDMDADTRSKIEEAINQRVAQAACQARMAGQMGADLERIISGILEPEVPWPDLLREFMLSFKAEDECWSRRNRRFSNVVLPTRWSETMGEMTIIVDTSGSVFGNDGYFARIATELNYIKDVIKPSSIRVVWADDAECSGQDLFEEGEELVFHPKGGGGTDMRKPLRHVEQFDPCVVILITDGYTPWPEETPYPLLVLSTTQVVSPVGTTIHVTT